MSLQFEIGLVELQTGGMRLTEQEVASPAWVVASVRPKEGFLRGTAATAATTPSPSSLSIKEKMIALMGEAEASGTPLTPSDAVSQVLGTKSGYLKGMGHGEPSIPSCVRGQSRSSSSQQFTNAIQELEETKRELQETKGELAYTKDQLANIQNQFTSLSSEVQEIRGLLLNRQSQSNL